MNARPATADRDAIRAAIDRLLAGTPLRSNGSLTIVALADEANVKRHLLTHRHTDLKDEFYARVRARGHVPDNELKLRDDLAKATDRIKELLAEVNKLQGENDAFARIINVLELENHQLRNGLGRTGRLVALPAAHER
jgi:septal ring factor EnvC (AmiA/AmiB activator)